MSIALLPRFSNVIWLNSHNKHCEIMAVGNYSTLLIGDSIIDGLSGYSNIWNRYLKLLNAINCGIGGDRRQNILWRCQNLPSSPHLQSAVIKQHPTQFCRRYCRWDCRNCTLIKAQIPSNHYICLWSPSLL